MKCIIWNVMAAAALIALPAVCQQKVPLYRVTVIQRSIDAVNYQYRSGPTKIDFTNTVLLPSAKGDATVDPQKGRTSIDAKFEGLEAPQRFGAEYLSYVMWAITPDGAPHNLGEIIPNASNKAHLPVTTDLQAFGLIVTAEPYAAVRQPSDLVVLQNEIRPDTVGEVRPILAKVELLPRGAYTWNVPVGEPAELANAPKVSMSRYQAILQVYEAQNALGAARAAGAEKYAADVYANAHSELDKARQLQNTKGNDDRIVQYARAATEIADDARTIAERHRQEEEIVAARKETAEAQQAQLQAEVTALRERQRADAANDKAQTDRAARERAELEARMANERAAQAAAISAQPVPAAPVQTVVVQDSPAQEGAAKEARLRTLHELNTAVFTRDTPRGLSSVLHDSDFAGTQLRPGPENALSQVAKVLAAHPDLKITVEGNSDTAEGAGLAGKRATAVAAALIRAGIPAAHVSNQSLGNSRPLVSNATAQGRVENRRVEIVISGDSIGSVPSWDRTYPLSFNRK